MAILPKEGVVSFLAYDIDFNLMELVLAGNVFLDGKLNKCSVGIEDGKIVSIKKVLKGDREFDFGDKLVLPAGIDIHTHFRDPGMTHKEDFRTGTEAAAFGGIACVLDMPNTIPPVTDMEAFNEKLHTAGKKSYIDFGLYSAVTPRSDLKRLANFCTGFKLYLGETTGKLTYNDLDGLMKKLEELELEHEMVLAVHAEDNTALEKGGRTVDDDKNRSVRDHEKRRPVTAETTAVNNMLMLSERLGVKKLKLHICHLTSPESLKLLAARENISKEVTPHHMFLNKDVHTGLRTFGKVNPPLRGKADMLGMLDAFTSGVIPIAASDHAPHTIDEKEQSFNDAPSGIPGVETMLPLLLSLVKHGKITLNRFVDGTSVKPAGLFGLNKGRIAIGYDADLIVVDSKTETALKSGMLHSKCGWSPFEKMPVIFPRMTVSRGNVIIRNGGCEGEEGRGRFIRSAE